MSNILFFVIKIKLYNKLTNFSFDDASYVPLALKHRHSADSVVPQKAKHKKRQFGMTLCFTMFQTPTIHSNLPLNNKSWWNKSRLNFVNDCHSLPFKILYISCFSFCYSESKPPFRIKLWRILLRLITTFYLQVNWFFESYLNMVVHIDISMLVHSLDCHNVYLNITVNICKFN